MSPGRSLDLLSSDSETEAHPSLDSQSRYHPSQGCPKYTAGNCHESTCRSVPWFCPSLECSCQAFETGFLKMHLCQLESRETSKIHTVNLQDQFLWSLRCSTWSDFTEDCIEVQTVLCRSLVGPLPTHCHGEFIALEPPFYSNWTRNWENFSR